MGELAIIDKSLINFPVISTLTPKILLHIASQPYSQDCHIKASHDLAAVNAWLNRYIDSPKTFTSYKREAERLLLWCIYERGLALGQLKVEDFTTYFHFLKMPPASWCATRKDFRKGKQSSDWRPFLGPLSQTAYDLAVRTLNSLMNFLVTAEYLKFNPIKLTGKTKDFQMTLEAQKYSVWERMLEQDEWAAVQQTLQNMPEETDSQIANKIRTQFLFAMLYFLGLRINELATHSWNAFRCRGGEWWFFVKGKGGKLRHIPVNNELLSFVKIYRLHLRKTPLPEVDDTDYMLFSKHTNRPLNMRQIYALVKAIGKEVAQQFTEQPFKKQKLEKFSPHWLRHLSASHQNNAGTPATMIKENHGHSSVQTTNNIYVHTEDALRYQAIQKLELKVDPRLTEKTKMKAMTTVVEILLKGGPLSHELSLEKLLDMIENNIFTDLSWELEDKSRKALLCRYQQTHIYKQPLLITYRLHNIYDELLNYIQHAIAREADIRLFSCEIRINNASKDLL